MDDLPQRPAALSHILTLTTILGTTLSVLRAKGALTDKEIEAILNGTERVLPEMDKENGREVIEHVRRITQRLATPST